MRAECPISFYQDVKRCDQMTQNRCGVMLIDTKMKWSCNNFALQLLLQKWQLINLYEIATWLHHCVSPRFYSNSVHVWKLDGGCHHSCGRLAVAWFGTKIWKWKSIAKTALHSSRVKTFHGKSTMSEVKRKEIVCQHFTCDPCNLLTAWWRKMHKVSLDIN